MSVNPWNADLACPASLRTALWGLQGCSPTQMATRHHGSLGSCLWGLLQAPWTPAACLCQVLYTQTSHLFCAANPEIQSFQTCLPTASLHWKINSIPTASLHWKIDSIHTGTKLFPKLSHRLHYPDPSFLLL